MDIAQLLVDLDAHAPKGAIVYVAAQQSGNISKGTLYEERLTDGSLVYNIHLH